MVKEKRSLLRSLLLFTKRGEMANLNAGSGTGHAYPRDPDDAIWRRWSIPRRLDHVAHGIKQRRKAAPGEYTSLFAVRAARQAIERARIEASDIDLLICATVTPDQLLPSTGCLIQAELGANRAAAFDLAAACSGFLYGLTLANQMIRTGQARYALVIGAEVLTQYVDYTDRSTCVIFGDGAGAAVLGGVERRAGFWPRAYAPTGALRNISTRREAGRAWHYA